MPGLHYYCRTATDDLLGADSNSIMNGHGPIGLKQLDGWTYGALVGNHLWSYAARGNGDATEVDATFLQPFIGWLYNIHVYIVFLNTESTYDWVGNDWSVPINFMVSQVFQDWQTTHVATTGARYWADTPEGAGPEGWGGRLTYTLVLPK